MAKACGRYCSDLLQANYTAQGLLGSVEGRREFAAEGL